MQSLLWVAMRPTRLGILLLKKKMCVGGGEWILEDSQKLPPHHPSLAYKYSRLKWLIFLFQNPRKRWKQYWCLSNSSCAWACKRRKRDHSKFFWDLEVKPWNKRSQGGTPQNTFSPKGSGGCSLDLSSFRALSSILPAKEVCSGLVFVQHSSQGRQWGQLWCCQVFPVCT